MSEYWRSCDETTVKKVITLQKGRQFLEEKNRRHRQFPARVTATLVTPLRLETRRLLQGDYVYVLRTAEFDSISSICISFRRKLASVLTNNAVASEQCHYDQDNRTPA